MICIMSIMKKNRVLHHMIEGVAIDNIIVALNGNKRKKPMPLGDNYCNERLQFKEITFCVGEQSTYATLVASLNIFSTQHILHSTYSFITVTVYFLRIE